MWLYLTPVFLLKNGLSIAINTQYIVVVQRNTERVRKVIEPIRLVLEHLTRMSQQNTRREHTHQQQHRQ
jgi:hypothetical protein